MNVITLYPLSGLSVQSVTRFAGSHRLPPFTKLLYNGEAVGQQAASSVVLSPYTGPTHIGTSITKWPHYQYLPKHIPLETAGMNACSALIIQTPTHHFMAHLPSQCLQHCQCPDGWRTNTLTRVLQQVLGADLNKPTTKMYILPGRSAYSSESTQDILSSLDACAPRQTVNYLHYPPTVVGQHYFAQPNQFGAQDDTLALPSCIAVVSYNGSLGYRLRSNRHDNLPSQSSVPIQHS